MAKKRILQQGGDGTAVPTGMVGEVYESVNSSGTNVANTGATTVTSFTLQPGTWDIGFNVYAQSTSLTCLNAGISTATDSTAGWEPLYNSTVAAGNSSMYPYVALSGYRVNISSATTYYLTAQVIGAASALCRGRIYARRS
jgi:hypothetical protein